MRRLPTLASVLPLLLAAPALAQGQGGSGGASHGPQSGSHQQISQQDQQWLDYAATDNQGEIQESLLAEKMAQSLALKAFVRLMVDDHVQVESRLAALVNTLGVNVPDGPGQKAEKTIAEMKKLHGSAFDRSFIQDQIKDHSDDIRKFSEETQATHNAAIRRFALETLPILRQHLALAQAVQASLQQESGQQQSGGGQSLGGVAH